MDKYVLVIDDDRTILEGFKGILAKENYWVDTAASAKEAKIFLTNRHYHAILMDIVLKDTTAIEFIKDIKQNSKETAVIMITGYPTVESAIQSFRLGADDYLIKPIKKGALLEALKRNQEKSKEYKKVTSLERIKEALERANQEKGILLKNISKTISSATKDLLHANGLLMSSSVAAHQMDHLAFIKMRTEYLENFARNIQDIIDLEAGDLQFQEKEIQLASFIRDVIKTVYPLLKDLPVEISFEIERDIPQFLWGDEQRLRQLFLMLLMSTVRSTREGKVWLKARVMAIVGRGCHVFFTIKGGGGLPRVKQMEIFKPFSEQSEQIEKKENISCLDLWMSKVLVEKMGGLMSVHSSTKKGLEFRFSIRFTMIE